MKKKLLIFLVLIALVSFGVYQYVYKSHRSIADEKAAFELKTSELIESYKTDENAANAKFLDQTITVTGQITAVNPSEKTITIDEKLFGIVADDINDLKVNETITFKGRFLGYDELLEEVKMDQITITN